MESESNTQTGSQLFGSFGNLSQGKRRLTATEMLKIQKLKRESSFTTDPYLNQPMNLTEFSMPPMEDPFLTEHNTSSNREMQKTGAGHLFQAPFPNLVIKEYKSIVDYNVCL